MPNARCPSAYSRAFTRMPASFFGSGRAKASNSPRRASLSSSEEEESLLSFPASSFSSCTSFFPTATGVVPDADDV